MIESSIQLPEGHRTEKAKRVARSRKSSKNMHEIYNRITRSRKPAPEAHRAPTSF
jgi:hypothetical protein